MWQRMVGELQLMQCQRKPGGVGLAYLSPTRSHLTVLGDLSTNSNPVRGLACDSCLIPVGALSKRGRVNLGGLAYQYSGEKESQNGIVSA